MLQLLREPLLHFVVIAAALFFLYDWRHQATMPTAAHEIVLTEDDLAQMTLPMMAQGYAPPSPEQMDALIQTKVREEVMYREALAMGLDHEDTIIKRRLVQKMDFLAEDLSALREPTENELRDWLAAHPGDFAFPARISLHHFFFSFDEHGADTERMARAAYAGVEGQPAEYNEVSADIFMFQDTYVDKTFAQLAAVFGTPFAATAFNLQPGIWSAPVESGYGWHLVFVDVLTPERLPEYEEVSAEVRMQWLAKQRSEFKQAAYDAMRAKYKVVLPATMSSPTVTAEAGSPQQHGTNPDSSSD